MFSRLAMMIAFLTGALPAGQPPFGVNLQHRPISTLAPPGTRAVVLFFLATDCPISARYQPTIAHLAQEFERDHIAMWAVFPNPSETTQAIQAHQLAFSQTVTALQDPDQSLVRLAEARTTPEAAILIPTPSGLHRVYLGRIDDRYLSLGTQRPQSTHNDLELAIQAVLAHRRAPQPTGPTVGCSIIPKP